MQFVSMRFIMPSGEDMVLYPRDTTGILKPQMSGNMLKI